MSFKGGVKLQNIGKFYPIYNSPKDRLKEILMRKEFHRKLWVLRDINLVVNPGETLGVIGDNGAGKSTLLKIIAGTLSPSTGSLRVDGRVSAILELGMGFHPEMTGVENIFLSGSLMGLSKKEIEGKIKDIVEFSELGDFINRPVKTYSSGMYVRLAFSIATSVDPDILIIDEALSVGDSYFQKKSLDRIMEFKNRGKTIIFCSHSMYHITRLCNRVIWLDRGRIRREGEVLEVVSEYEEHCRKRAKKEEKPPENYNPLVSVSTVELSKTELFPLETLSVYISYKNPEKRVFHVGVAIKRDDGVTCFGTSTLHDGLKALDREEGRVTFEIPRLPLMSGGYELIAATIDSTGNLTYDAKSVKFRVLKRRDDIGMVWMDHRWRIG